MKATSIIFLRYVFCLSVCVSVCVSACVNALTVLPTHKSDAALKSDDLLSVSQLQNDLTQLYTDLAVCRVWKNCACEYRFS
jgi:hypothetical protein